ncbi:hypothetical protein SAMN05428947_101649 [Mucilaginibacter sp. OK283]|jgi:hypothetical protein|nr:hypothetical protein SAMN05428947_101649 [Mucilaginibacter sp. OK283]
MAIAGTGGVANKDEVETMLFKYYVIFLIPSLGRARVRYERKGREGLFERPIIDLLERLI